MIPDKPSLEEALAHFGVRGMRWGVRSASSTTNRSLNKASRAKDKASRTKAQAERGTQIDAARSRISTGKSKQDYKKARAQYKIDKKVIGSREARKVLNKAKNKRLNDYNTASEAKNGKELAKQILAAYAADKLVRDLTSPIR
jgi:hypothetical protein